VVHKKRRRRNADKWERMQLLSVVVRIAEMLLDLWRDHIL
jgi:hypothetical protein